MTNQPDIVERLRDFGKRWGESCSGPMGWLCFQEHYNEAADEIERLRKALAAQRDARKAKKGAKR